jgi:hypothetical protein
MVMLWLSSLFLVPHTPQQFKHLQIFTFAKLQSLFNKTLSSSSKYFYTVLYFKTKWYFTKQLKIYEPG